MVFPRLRPGLLDTAMPLKDSPNEAIAKSTNHDASQPTHLVSWWCLYEDAHHEGLSHYFMGQGERDGRRSNQGWSSNAAADGRSEGRYCIIEPRSSARVSRLAFEYQYVPGRQTDAV